MPLYILLFSLFPLKHQISSQMEHPSLLLILLLVSSLDVCLGFRRLTSLYKQPPISLKYHNGELLEGDIPISILWYGNFSSSQKSIIIDFLLSLTPQHTHISSTKTPTVSKWWKTIDSLLIKVGKQKTNILLSKQSFDSNYSIGKILKRSQVDELVSSISNTRGGVVLVLTAEDVAVEGFCMSNCGFHGANSVTGQVFIWVGDSSTQCPGQCAWPFHQPLYGPQEPALVAPNGDVGVDGMVINIATLMAGTVSDPFGSGYFEGVEGAAVEVAAACAGVYGKGSYPGHVGEVLVDADSGGSYNVEGLNGRKYLVPAMVDPSTCSCSPVV